MTRKRKHGAVGRSGGVVYRNMEWKAVFIWCQLAPKLVFKRISTGVTLSTIASNCAFVIRMYAPCSSCRVIHGFLRLRVCLQFRRIISTKQEGCIVWNDTIQYSPDAGQLSVHKLFTSCLLSGACDWVMSALSASLLIFSFQFSLLFFHISVARPHQHYASYYWFWYAIWDIGRCQKFG